MKQLGLIPLRNFAVVDENKGIYRAAQPMYSYEYKWLKNKLNIGLIVNLRSELNRDMLMVNYIGEKDIKVVTYSVPDHYAPTLQQANDFINLIKNNNNLLFHCEHGHGRTSTFCVLARLAMGWTLQDAINEESELYEYEFKHKEQLDFLNDNFLVMS